MYSTYYKSGDSSRSMISSFGGINRRARISDGESADMKNLSSDAYPLICPRKARSIAQKQLSETVTETVTDEKGNETTVETTVYKSLNGILGDVGFCAVWGSDFYYMGEKVDGISLIDGEKRLVAFGAYILVYPDQVYYNTANGESGAMESGVTYGKTLTQNKFPKIYYSASSMKFPSKITLRNGDNHKIIESVSADISYLYNQELFDFEDSFTVWNTKGNTYDPEFCMFSLKDGYLYYLYSANVSKLYNYAGTVHYVVSDAVWEKANVYRMEMDYTLAELKFSDEQINSIWVGDEHLNIVKSNDTYYIYGSRIGAYVDIYKSNNGKGKLCLNTKYSKWRTRTLPALDHVCVCDNRLWGCRYGDQISTQEPVNEIYCSALGDFKNWTTGTTADSAWRASVGAYGKWTGCVAMNGRVLFFKDDKIFRVSGTKPSNFQYAEISETGLQSGCERSMSIIDGALFYKSRDGVYVYDGSTPERISDKLGDAQQAKSAAAGSLYGKYYIALDGVLYVYDTRTGLWHKEDAVNARIFARYDGSLYAAVDQSIVCLSGTPSGIFKATEAEGRFDWYAESGDIGLDSPDQKYYKRILIRAEGAVGSDMTVTVETDGEVQSVTDYTFDRKGTVVVPIVTPRCDHMRYRIGGHGDVKIYSISFETETVGDTPERR